MHDAIVLGAGPAGSAAAYHLSRAGLRVLIVDRAPFPRSKTCGDALTPQALAALHRTGVSLPGGYVVRGLRLVHVPSGCTRDDDFAGHPQPAAGLVVARAILDSALLEHARRAGAEFKVARARELLWEGNQVSGAVLDTPAGERRVRALAVIGATGSTGARALFGRAGRTERGLWGVAARTYLQGATEFDDRLEVYFPLAAGGRLLSGYGWLFPCGRGRINAGVGIFCPPSWRPVPLVRLLEGFLQDRIERDCRLRHARPCSPIRSAPIALAPLVRSVPGLLPVGDLAGLANPFTGEGIGPAIISGELAARAVVEGPSAAETRYRGALRELLPTRVRLARALCAVHHNPYPYLGRGWDAAACAHRGGPQALRNLLWDLPVAVPPWAILLRLPAGSAVAFVADAMVAAAARLRPVLGELVRHLLAEPSTRFGWHAGFASALRSAWAAGQWQRRELQALTVLEVANLVAALHGELTSGRCERQRSTSWGRNTLNLVLADCLTAHALQLTYDLGGELGGSLARTVWRRLRAEAVARSGNTQARAALQTTAAEMLLAGARVAAGQTQQAAVPAAARATASAVAALQFGGDPARDVGAARCQIASAPPQLGGYLGELLDVLLAWPQQGAAPTRRWPAPDETGGEDGGYVCGAAAKAPEDPCP